MLNYMIIWPSFFFKFKYFPLFKKKDLLHLKKNVYNIDTKCNFEYFSPIKNLIRSHWFDLLKEIFSFFTYLFPIVRKNLSTVSLLSNRHCATFALKTEARETIDAATFSTRSTILFHFNKKKTKKNTHTIIFILFGYFF